MVSLIVERMQKCNCIRLLVLRKHHCLDRKNTKEIPFHTLLTCSCATKIKFEGEDLKQVIKSEYIGITKPQQFRPQRRIHSDHKSASIPSTIARQFPPHERIDEDHKSASIPSTIARRFPPHERIDEDHKSATIPST